MGIGLGNYEHSSERAAGLIIQAIWLIINFSNANNGTSSPTPYTYGSIHPVRVEPVSPRIGGISWVGSTPRSLVPVSLHLLSL